MFDYEFTVTDFGVLGTLPTGEQLLFSTEEEYRQAYQDEEDAIYDGMAEYYAEQIVEYPDFV